MEMPEQDLTKCPNCGGEADNGHDRCIPPNPYYCKECTDGNLGRIVEAMKAELKLQDEANDILTRQNEELKAKLDRWADAHNELTTEIELRTRITELEEFIKTTHPYPEQR